MKTITIMLLIGGFTLFMGVSNVYSQTNKKEEEKTKTTVKPAVTTPSSEKPNTVKSTVKSEPVPGAEVYIEQGTSGIEPAAGGNNPENTNTTGKKEEEEKKEEKKPESK